MHLLRLLSERRRSFARALKLGDYLAKRHSDATFKYHNPRDRPMTNKIDIADHLQTNYDNSDAYEHADDLFARKHRNIHRIPMNKIKADQHAVYFDSKFAKRDKRNRRPINLFKHEDGTYTIVDGHHRWMMRKLLGRSRIRANVQDINQLNQVRD